ncbi:MAG TPA: bifunctional 5,10-methylenetetrahydrofolate dehydrogenase/5,10-methenyltetrahydrofolate cyclohydrolase [Candidatus Dormibacteraeota bacterium]|jgi:methylenetetrahydrofolate dehydrogenase (NADP+)/methenyltetrahydrofolate cyclohydrolase|nr:bifunctional 5,10-methylenetetrahydrofolate dehydrogenase/5,10-methenyltetrahydrofolate cyclohydrolase [Candidatus Dormibacteraeota bacterium]
MSAVIVDGKAVAAELREELAEEIVAMTAGGGPPPSLAVVLCGDDPASAIYVRNKGRAAERAGIHFALHRPPAESTTAELVDLVRRLDADQSIDGVLVQLPLPAHIDARAVTECISQTKDADGFHPYNFGRLAEGHPGPVAPGTPLGCMELLRRSGQELRGRRAVVIGRSAIVGRPIALLLTNADATVTICHSRTEDLAAVCREADILVAAIGRPGMVDASYIKPGAFVIDVGTTPVDGALKGDVDRASVEPVAGWLTPVPGGVGPMTVAMLLRNTVSLAQARRAQREVS